MHIFNIVVVAVTTIIICLLFREDEVRIFCGTYGRDEKSDRVWREDLKERDHVQVMSIGE